MVLPVADTTDVHMNEVGIGVKAHSAGLQVHGGLAKMLKGEMGDSDIYRLADHVQTVLGDAAGVFAQKRIGFRGTEARNDMEGFVGFEFFPEDEKQVQQHPVDFFGVTCSMVTKDVIYLGQGIGAEGPIFEIAGLEFFPCVGIVEGKRAVLRSQIRERGAGQGDRCSGERSYSADLDKITPVDFCLVHYFIGSKS